MIERPASFNWMLRPLRSNNWRWHTRSSVRICAPTAACVSAMRSAAAAMVPCFSIARNVRSIRIPERLWAASIGAPGNVTVLDQTKDWSIGVGGFERHFGKPFDVAALKRVPVQMVVGRAELRAVPIASAAEFFAAGGVRHEHHVVCALAGIRQAGGPRRSLSPVLLL